MSAEADAFVPPDSDFEDTSTDSGSSKTLGDYLKEVLPFAQTGLQAYQTFTGKGNAPAPKAATSSFNWKPVLIGAGALVGLVVLVLLFRRK